MNFQRGMAKDDPEINLIPLIDVLLVILIFLMVTTTYARFAELQINLPEAQGQTPEEEPAHINVNVDAGGNYQINDGAPAQASVDALASMLTQAAGSQKEPVVVISADARAAHQSVIRVMDAARRVGFTKVTFVTQSTAAESP